MREIHIFSKLKYAVLALRKPTMIVRFIDKDGGKKIVVVNRTPFGCKAIGKFKISQEFAPTSFLPKWEPVEFTTSIDFQEKDGN